MQAVSIFHAKTHLSRIVESIASHKEDKIIISRHGKPVAQITDLENSDTSNRIGIAKGLYDIPDNIDSANKTIAAMFTDSESTQ